MMNIDKQLKQWAQDFKQTPDTSTWDKVAKKLDRNRPPISMVYAVKVAAGFIFLLCSIFLFRTINSSPIEYKGENFTLSPLNANEVDDIYSNEKVSLLVKAYSKHN